MPYALLSDGTPLHYVEAGEGATILLMPGWTFTTRIWRRQLDDLARDHRVVSLDLRGAGESGKPRGGHSLSGYARDTAELLEQLDLRDVTVVAWAMAASVTVTALAAGHGGRIGRFVWVDHSPRFTCAPGWPYPLYGDMTPDTLDATLLALDGDRPAMTWDLIDSMFANPIDPADRREMYVEIMKTPTRVAVDMLADVARTDLRPLLDDVRVPVLAVNGRESIVPPDVGPWLAGALPDGRAVVLDGAGHAPFWDDPQAFNRAVRDFVGG